MEHEVQDALLVSHPRRFAHGAYAYLDRDGAVHGHLLQVDVEQLLGDGIELQLADDREPGAVARLTVELEGEQLGRALVTVDHP